MTDPKQTIEGEVLSVSEMQTQLSTLETELMQLESFQQFVALSKAVNNRMAEVRENIKQVMIPAYQKGDVDKTVKGDWGSVTVTETDDFEIDESALPKKYFKTVPDTSKIRKMYHLEGGIKGVEASRKYNVMVKFK